MKKSQDLEMEPTICLDELLNLSAALPLAAALKAARGSDLTLDAGKVRHLGAQCGQILLAGMSTWQADGHTLRIMDPAAGFIEGMHLLGLDTFFSDEETHR